MKNYILTINDLEDYPKSESYRILFLGSRKPEKEYPLEVFSDSSSPEENRLLGELTGQFWLRDNLLGEDPEEIIGFAQERRYFDLSLDRYSSEVKSLLDSRGIILPQRVNFKDISVEDHYSGCHRLQDLKELLECLPEGYEEAKERVLGRNYLYCCNMYITKFKDFCKIIDFLKETFERFREKTGLWTLEDMKKRINDNLEEYTKGKFPPCDSPEYQERLFGFLSERLLNVYFEKHFSDPVEIPVVETKPRYKEGSLFKIGKIKWQ